ncbi:uncharacterized protein LOC125036611 [Penaeus chinensis]|uniref:uncharacterized protein LOC125036611 n=1 Tax=Penaeus chinensis TaxID=139456 RepID=UPI001FB64463|nr:uncharacterized protein LOC125036611 [Penaeus chinensis]
MLKLCVLFAAVALSRGGSPNITLYSGTQQTGASLFLTTNNHDLRAVDFNDAAESLCGHGAWLLYENPSYQQSEFTHLFVSPGLECEDLSSSQRNKVTSLRYIGVGDLHIESLTLYHDYEGGGGELLLVRDDDYIRDFNDIASSLAVVGPSSWTLYEDPYFTGGSACVVPSLIEGSDVYFGYFSVGEVGFADNKLSSVRKGCYSTNVKVYHP